MARLLSMIGFAVALGLAGPGTTASASCSHCPLSAHGPAFGSHGGFHGGFGVFPAPSERVQRAAGAVHLAQGALHGTVDFQRFGSRSGFVSAVGPYGYYYAPGTPPSLRSPDWVDAVRNVRPAARASARSGEASVTSSPPAWTPAPAVTTPLENGATVTSQQNMDGSWTHVLLQERRDGSRIHVALEPGDRRIPDDLRLR